MILKIKELYDKCIILKIEDGVYSIDIHGTKLEIINGRQFSSYEIETLETYEAMDYSVEEMVDKLENINKILNNDNIDVKISKETIKVDNNFDLERMSKIMEDEIKRFAKNNIR